MRARHTAAAVSATFDEPNLVSCAGLVPVLRLAERAGLHAAADRRVLGRCQLDRKGPREERQREGVDPGLNSRIKKVLKLYR